MHPRLHCMGPFSLFCIPPFTPIHPCLLLSVIHAKPNLKPRNTFPQKSHLLKSHPGFCFSFLFLGAQIFSNQLYLLSLDSPHLVAQLSPPREAARGEPRVPFCCLQPNPISRSHSAHAVGAHTFGYQYMSGSLCRPPPICPFKCTHGTQRVFLGTWGLRAPGHGCAMTLQCSAVQSGPGQIPAEECGSR